LLGCSTQVAVSKRQDAVSPYQITSNGPRQVTVSGPHQVTGGRPRQVASARKALISEGTLRAGLMSYKQKSGANVPKFSPFF